MAPALNFLGITYTYVFIVARAFNFPLQSVQSGSFNGQMVQAVTARQFFQERRINASLLHYLQGTQYAPYFHDKTYTFFLLGLYYICKCTIYFIINTYNKGIIFKVTYKLGKNINIL